MLQENGGVPADLVVCFANTGKEEEATLRFVRDCGERWSVPIVWLEYTGKRSMPRYAVVSFETASRNGEPFETAIGDHNILPNPTARYCSGELKRETVTRYLRDAHGWAVGDFELMLGMRADEMRRVANLRNGEKRFGDRTAPLAHAGVTASDVGEFWRRQPFDLGLPNMNGKTMHGNCDLCFLKPAAQVLALIKERPERSVWWAAQESRPTRQAIESGRNRSPSTFRDDRPSYAALATFARDQRDMFDPDEAGLDCLCGD